MFDPVDASLREIASGSIAALALVALAGAATSIGPCTAPRMVAIVSLVVDSPVQTRVAITAAFVLGLIFVYGAFGTVADLLIGIAANSHWIYAVFAGGMACAGAATILRKTESHACEAAADKPRSLGAAFLMGAGFALVISPCCTPMVVTILAYGVQLQSAYYETALLLAYGLGHAAPVIAAAAMSGGVAARLQSLHNGPALRLASGTLMIALSGFYLCLI